MTCLHWKAAGHDIEGGGDRDGLGEAADSDPSPSTMLMSVIEPGKVPQVRGTDEKGRGQKKNEWDTVPYDGTSWVKVQR